MSNNNWVSGIEEEIKNAPKYRLLWGIILLLSGFFILFLEKRPDILGEISDIMIIISLFVFVFALIKISHTPKAPEYLAYYFYKIGDGFTVFGDENRYLEKNKQYIKNCNGQILYLRNEIFHEHFVGDINKFYDDLEDLIMRLNHLYSVGNKDETMMVNVKGLLLDSPDSDGSITEREFISRNLMDLANLIYREHSILTHNHATILRRILDELDYIPKRQFKKSLSKYAEEIWNKLSYPSKCLIFLTTFSVIIFVIVSQILVYFNQEQPYAISMGADAVLTAAVLTKIEWFISR